MIREHATSTNPLLDLLFEDPAAGRCLVAPDGSVLRVNAEWLRATGYSLDEVLGEDVLSLFPESRELAVALHARARAGHRVEVPRHAQRVNEQETSWDGTIDPVPMAGGTGLLITAREVPGSGRGAADAPPAGEEGPSTELLGRLRQIADHVPAAVFLKGPDGRYLFANRWLRELLGVRRHELVGRTVAEVMPAEIARRTEEHDRRVAAGQEVASEETVPTPRGDRVLLIVRFAFPVAGGATGTLGIAIDVTDARRAEAALREQLAVKDQLAKVAASVPGVVCSFRQLPDGRARMSFSAPGIEELYGVTREELARDMGPVFARTCPEDLARVAAEVAESARSMSRWHARFRYHHPTKGLRWIEGTSLPAREPDGSVVWHGYVVDVTDRELAEEALRESVARFTTLADHIAQLAWMADGSGAVFWFNRRWFEYTGTTLDDVRGWGWRTVHHPDHVDRVLAKLTRCFETGEAWEDTFPLRRHDGVYRWFLSRAVPVRDEQGRVTRWLGTSTDVSERLEAEAVLRDANRRKNEFLGMLSHELRNPLAPIRNALYVLDHVEPSGRQASWAMEVARRQVDHLARLVDDLLDVTRIERGKIELRWEDLDLAALVARTSEDYRALLRERGLDLTLDLPAAPVLLRGDPTRLAQVVGNLLNNAAKFTPAGGRVSVSVSAGPGEAVVRVRDTGVGIEPATLQSMFDPFVQGNQSLARTEGGLGLGLALVKGFVTLHGGTVSASSGEAQHGSEFVVTLPLATRCGRPAARSAPAPARKARRTRVLVVDDNRDAAESLATVVQVLGHEADTAFDGASAIAKVHERPPDVVLCDIGLPGMDGYEVARALRAEFGDRLRLVAVSGYAQPEDVRKAAEAGFDEHVAKPPELGTVQRAIEGR